MGRVCSALLVFSLFCLHQLFMAAILRTKQTLLSHTNIRAQDIAIQNNVVGPGSLGEWHK